MAPVSGDRPVDVPPIPAPSDIEPNATFLIMALGRRLRERAETRLRERRMSMRHLAALGHLSRDPGCSYSELARRAGVTAQSMQATLRQLEELGAVERRSPPGRGRTAQLHVTQAGAELHAWARSVISGLDDEVLAPLPLEQRTVVTSTLLTVFTADLRRQPDT